MLPLPPGKASSIKESGKSGRQAGGGNSQGMITVGSTQGREVPCLSYILVWHLQTHLMIPWCHSLPHCKQGHRASQEH